MINALLLFKDRTLFVTIFIPSDTYDIKHFATVLRSYTFCNKKPHDIVIPRKSREH